MKKKIALLTIAISITLGFLVSCEEILLNEIPESQLDFPEANFFYTLVNSNLGITVFSKNKISDDLDVFVREGERQIYHLNLPNDPSCYQTVYDVDQIAPDGQLQIWRRCESGGNGVRTYLMAYDWETKQLQTITENLPLGSFEASWNPRQTKAIALLRSGFANNTLFWLWEGGYAPLDLVVGEGEQSWNLKDDFPHFEAAEIGKSGSTGRATWSPDGRQIAFFASPDAVGRLGFDRFSVEYNLYLMNPETLDLTMIADNTYSPFLMAWSSDSKSIAFIGKRGFWKEHGIWVYSLEKKSVFKVSAGIFQGVVWRPETSKLVAIKCESLDICSQIVEYDLSGVLQE